MTEAGSHTTTPACVPQQAFAAQFVDGSKQGTAKLLRWSPKTPAHQRGKTRKDSAAMAVIVLKVVALIFQGVERLIGIFHRASGAHAESRRFLTAVGYQLQC